MNFLSSLISIVIGLLLNFNTKVICSLIVGRIGDKDYAPSKRFLFYTRLAGILFIFLGVTSMVLVVFA